MRRLARGRVRDPPLPVYPTRRYGVCVHYLASDSTPHLRKHWTLGWVVACERHHVLLNASCQECCGGFMLPLLNDTRRFQTAQCTRHACPLVTQATLPAHPFAIHLQQALLAGRETDTFDWPR